MKKNFENHKSVGDNDQTEIGSPLLHFMQSEVQREKELNDVNAAYIFLNQFHEFLISTLYSSKNFVHERIFAQWAGVSDFMWRKHTLHNQ